MVVVDAPDVVVEHVLPAPVAELVASAPTVTYAAPAPVVEVADPAPAVTYMTPAPVVEVADPAPAFTSSARHLLPWLSVPILHLQ